ncbi:hypothetical protein KU06062604_780007 [Flavobacterium psychrophilum]|uniref:ABC-three component system middle component 6 n=1 Tax=Flavobacterium psychrophilum TaxID=96345 RepID=UPI000B7C4DCA|nr:hypothetical protein KU06062604_780007 [Flavobacterium psychrophilum]
MLIPTKHQELKSNTLVLGADILFYLKTDLLSLEDLFKKIRTEKNIYLNDFLDSLTFLWLIDAIEYSENMVTKKITITNDFREDIF